MGLSHEKMVHLSHVVTDALEEVDSITFLKPHNQVRLEVIEALRREAAQEEEIEQRARIKITSMKKDIAEGSPEWDILYAKFVEEERDKRRRVR
jgi:hypothetical protein